MYVLLRNRPSRLLRLVSPRCAGSGKWQGVKFPGLTGRG